MDVVGRTLFGCAAVGPALEVQLGLGFRVYGLGFRVMLGLLGNLGCWALRPKTYWFFWRFMVLINQLQLYLYPY